MVEGRGGSDVDCVFSEILDGWGIKWLHGGGSVGVVRGDLDLCGIRVHGAGDVVESVVVLEDQSADDGVYGRCDHKNDPGQ